MAGNLSSIKPQSLLFLYCLLVILLILKLNAYIIFFHKIVRIPVFFAVYLSDGQGRMNQLCGEHFFWMLHSFAFFGQ